MNWIFTQTIKSGSSSELFSFLEPNSESMTSGRKSPATSSDEAEKKFVCDSMGS